MRITRGTGGEIGYNGRMERRSGFTLIELMIVLGIIVIISVVTAVSLFSVRNTRDLTNTANEIGTLLREAQSRAVNQDGGASWGVRMDNTTAGAPFYALFSGTYSTNSRTGVYPLPPDVQFDSSTVPSGGALEITFTELTGIPSAATSVVLDLMTNGAPSASTTISVNTAGLITY